MDDDLPDVVRIQTVVVLLAARDDEEHALGQHGWEQQPVAAALDLSGRRLVQRVDDDHHRLPACSRRFVQQAGHEAGVLQGVVGEVLDLKLETADELGADVAKNASCEEMPALAMLKWCTHPRVATRWAASAVLPMPGSPSTVT